MSDMTKEQKAAIDAMTYDELLSRWRFSPLGDPFFLGDTGDYFRKRFNELRESGDIDTVAASKRVGWDR